MFVRLLCLVWSAGGARGRTREEVYWAAVLYTEAPPSRPWEGTGRTRAGGPAASLKGGTAVTLLKLMELNQTDHLETSHDAKIFKMVKDYNQI